MTDFSEEFQLMLYRRRIYICCSYHSNRRQVTGTLVFQVMIPEAYCPSSPASQSVQLELGHVAFLLPKRNET